MRRKPTSQNNGGYNGGQQRNKPRYPNGGHNSGSGGGEHRSHNSGHHNSGRPRKNYAASREKYLSQARDALAAGDRVLAENYFQHADHCYRMMVEEGYQVRNNYTPPQSSDHQGGEQQDGEHQDNQQGSEHQASSNNEGNNEGSSDNGEQEHAPDPIHQLPAFLTANYDHAQTQAPAEPVVVPSWEE